MRILFIDIDTLRADRLSCAGYHRLTTPNIDALAAEGIRFDGVYASDVPCLPSRTALATGTFGSRNGVINHLGEAAELRHEGQPRGFISEVMRTSWATRLFFAGWHTASISSFPFRHSASWWTHGFMESMNLMRGFGAERADSVLPGALEWLDRRGQTDQWFLHVHLWDPHTPYNTPEDYGNPFAGDPVPEWHTEEVRARNWMRPGPHSAQEPWDFGTRSWHPRGTLEREPVRIASMGDVKRLFDFYDVGVRYADDAVGVLVDRLDSLGVLGETAILVSSDHGEAFGELGVYADHQAADEATAHIPSVLRWPGLRPRVDTGLHYHLDVAATVLELAGATVPVEVWDGQSFATALEAGDEATGRDHLVITQGAWTCQRGVRFGSHLYLRTWHDGYHGWPEEMLFDVSTDPHETLDLAAGQPSALRKGRAILDGWIDEQLARSSPPVDPMHTVLAEGGPGYCRGHLPAYLSRLRETGRSDWADELERRHPLEADPEFWVGKLPDREKLGADLLPVLREQRG